MRKFWKQLKAQWSTRALLKAGARYQRLGNFDELRALIASHAGDPQRHILHAMLARSYAERDDRTNAAREFSCLYEMTKGCGNRLHYVKLYALFNLALVRNSAAEAVYYSQKARGLPAPQNWKHYLPIPPLELEPRPWASIAATQ